MDLAIYGAQGLALGACQAICDLLPSRVIKCFLVTEQGINGNTLSGIPVLELKTFAQGLSDKEKAEIEVLIATPEDVMPEIERCLDEIGLCCHVRLTSLRWAELMGYHAVKDKKFMPLSALPVGYHGANLHVFMATSFKDKPLSDEYQAAEWVTPIRVGAALQRGLVEGLSDDMGEHISYKNKNYSELTALYWIWKNCMDTETTEEKKEYYGLCHYRRILNLSDDDVLRLTDNDVDVVLPFPMLYEPNIEEHHKRYVKDEDWSVLIDVLRSLYPEKISMYSDIMLQQYFYNYNIIIARKEVLKEYCSWLFPILEKLEELSIPKGTDRNDRYIGYIGETLSTVYFMANKDKLNIVHTGLRFLS